LFDSIEHSAGQAPADDAAGQAHQNKKRYAAARSLSAKGAKRRTPVDFEYESVIWRLIYIAECWQVCD